MFTLAALAAPVLHVVNHFWPGYTGQSWGWMMMFGSLPWSIAAAAVPAWIGMIILAVGLGVNMVIATTVVWYAIAWWLKTLRYRNDT